MGFDELCSRHDRTKSWRPEKKDKGESRHKMKYSRKRAKEIRSMPQESELSLCARSWVDALHAGTMPKWGINRHSQQKKKGEDEGPKAIGASL